jgi:flavin-dependent dehydrogenase
MVRGILKYDVIIIGGGPSGLSTALHLQRIFASGAYLPGSADVAPSLSTRILILEKEYYPRFKLCAGGLTLDAESILEHLDLDINEVPHVLAEDIHFDFEGRGLTVRMPKRHALRVIRRDEFDAWLAKKAMSRGIEIKQGVAVRNITPQADRVLVETDQGVFHSQIVVGADGSNSITRRCVLSDERVNTARVLEVITPVRSNESQPHPSDQAYFDFFPVPQNIAGYVWDFPTQIKGQPMRCWGIYDTNILAREKRPPLKEPLAKEMARHGYDLTQHEIKGHPIRWYSPWNQISVPRVLLVGDAAGVDPIFGEGISIALGYGAIAAREIHESFQRGEFSFRRFRRRVARSGLGQALISRWVITFIIYPIKWRWFQILLWRFFKPIVIGVAWLFVLRWGKQVR